MSAYTPRAVADAAPAEYRRQLRILADPQLRSDLAMVTSRPGRIKSLRSERAIAVVEAVDDPALLASLRHAEQRQRVGAEIAGHRLATRVAHHLWCGDCRLVEAGVTSFEEFTGSESGGTCALVPLRAIELTEDRELAERCWQHLLGGESYSWHTNAASAALRVAVAAGDLDADVPWVAEALGRELGWQERRTIAELIPRVGRMTAELLELWCVQQGGLPPTEIGADVLADLIRRTDRRRGAGTDHDLGIHGIEKKIFGIDDITALWPHLSLAAKAAAIRLYTDDPFFTWALDRLGDDPDWEQTNRSVRFEHMVAALRLRPDLCTERRLTLLAAGEYDTVARFALGELGAAPRPGEVRAAAASLAERDGQLTSLVEYTKSASNRTNAMRRDGMLELGRFLIDTVRAETLLLGDTELAAYAQRSLWEQLPEASQRTTALGLLAGWDGTIPALISTVTLLEDGQVA